MPPLQENYVDRILKAKVYDVAVETPLEPAPRLSRRLNNRVLFKRSKFAARTTKLRSCPRSARSAA